MTNPNEPAFVRRQIPKHKPGPDDAVYEHGITKREYFAGLAMQGLCADTNYDGDVAASSVKMADALIAELNKKEPQ